MNVHAVRAIYWFELSRWFRTLGQSLVTPVLTTSLYFIVFGAAIGGQMGKIDGVDYAAFIVPGLVMLAVLTETVSNASIGIYMPKWSGTIYELLSAPVSFAEVILGYVGAAATKSFLIAGVILLTARLFVSYDIAYPIAMIGILILITITFALVGFIIGLWASSWEQIGIAPSLILTPLTFLGGTFYAISMLPSFWQTVALFNPVVYLISAFRWSFFGIADVPVGVSLAATAGFMALCVAAIAYVFLTGYKIRA
ncbi:MAG TPA: sugar ABC transporter permease [Alphaproteobacteria bacterium]|nr:sugar ABC transporter permease [Alphaproteobacteria bacterium]HAJ46336.1 sugar ABC transporter permease [Alphaproteobacteria bacterium]